MKWPTPEVYLHTLRGHVFITAGFSPWKWHVFILFGTFWDCDPALFLDTKSRPKDWNIYLCFWILSPKTLGDVPAIWIFFPIPSLVIRFQNPGSTIDCNATNFNFSIFSNLVPPIFEFCKIWTDLKIRVLSKIWKNKSEESFGFGKTRMIHWMSHFSQSRLH